jgi:hypothetical protein
LHGLLNRLDIIVRGRGQTITPYKNPKSRSPKRLEGILIRLIVANVDGEHVRYRPTQAHVVHDPTQGAAFIPFDGRPYLQHGLASSEDEGSGLEGRAEPA